MSAQAKRAWPDWGQHSKNPDWIAAVENLKAQEAKRRWIDPKIPFAQWEWVLHQRLFCAGELRNPAVEWWKRRDYAPATARDAQMAAIARSNQADAPLVATSSDSAVIRSVDDLPSFESFAGHTLQEVVAGLIAVGTITMISGESGSGKTTWVVLLASSVERGVDFCGRPTMQLPVMYLDRENSYAISAERYQRLGIPPLQRHWGGWCASEAPDPASPIITEWANRCDPKPLIIVDSTIAFLPGDENSSSEVRPYMHCLRRLADAGSTIVMLHHSGKGPTSTDYRGTSDLKAAIDIGYKLQNLGDPSRLSTLKLTAFKSRFAVDSEVIFHYTDGRFAIDGNDASETNAEIMRGILIENPGITAQEFEATATTKGVRRGRARQYLADAIVAGHVEVLRGQRNSRYHNWVGR